MLSIVKRGRATGQRGLRRALMARSAHAMPLTELSEDEQMFKDAVAAFGREVVAPHVSQMDEEGQMNSEVLQGLFDQGLMGIEISSEHGGADGNFMSAVLAIEELAKVDPAVSVCVDVHSTMACNLVRGYASAALQDKYLPRLSTDMVGSFCLSEAGSGSDAFALQTRAVASPDGSTYTLNGQKLWITNAMEAGVFLVMANVDPSKGYKGITCFAVDRDTAGLEVGKKENKLGIRASSTCPVILNDVTVDASQIVGEIGHGYKYAIGLLNEGRVGIAAQMLGLAEGVYAHTVPYLFQRKQFGQAIGDFQAMQHQFAQCAMDIEAARLLTYNAARRKEAGMSVVKEGAMAKLYASQAAERVASACINMLGGVGFTKDFPVEKYFRDAKIGQIYEGTNNVQLNTIAKLVRQEMNV